GRWRLSACSRASSWWRDDAAADLVNRTGGAAAPSERIPGRKSRERSASDERLAVLPRRCPHHLAKRAAKVGLIGKAEIGRNLGEGFAAPQGSAGPLHAEVALIRKRGDAVTTPKEANQVKWADLGDPRQ